MKRGPGARGALVCAWLVVAAGAFPASRASAQEADLYDPSLVRAYDLAFGTANWDSLLRRAGDAGHARARLTLDGTAVGEVGVRYKGLSSMLINTPKKPLNVTVDAFEPGLRLRGFDVVNLNNGYSDPSFVREALMTEMLRPFLPTQRTAYADVTVNGDPLGAYLAVEQVEGTFLEAWFPGSEGVLVKCDPPAGPGMGARTFHSALAWEGEDLAAYRPLYEVKTDGAEDAGLTAIREAARVLDAPVAAGGATDAELPAAAERVLDVDGALWYLAANNLFVNYDSYYFGHNYFVYWAEKSRQLHMLLWDTSLSFGGLELGSWGGAGSGTRVDPFALEDAEDRPVLRRLLSVPRWRADYLAHYRVLVDAAFDPDVLERRGSALQALVRPVLERDPNRLFPLDLFDRNLREDVRPRTNMGPGGGAPGVVRFARERGDWLRGLPELAPPDHRLFAHDRQPEQPRGGEEAVLTLRFAGADAPTEVAAVYRADGGPPRTVALTRLGDAWVGALPGQPYASEVRYYVRVGLEADRAAFHPAANLTQPWRYRVRAPELPPATAPGLVINELMADNEATIADEAGEHDDWLELLNRSDAPIDLGAWYLGQDAAAPWRFSLPHVTLAPGAHYLVWCDGDPGQGSNHAPFRLDRDGEEVRLSSRTVTGDVVAFGPQEPDVSFARVPDGAEDWWSCRAPSPGEANRCPGVAVTTPTPTPTLTPTSSPTGAAYLALARR